MKTLLNDFRNEFRDWLLDLLWRQWTTLGVSGHGRTWEGTAIDPEALLLFSCSVARHDARLFDAMLDWMRINGRYINVQRIKRMFVQENFAGEAVFHAVAAVTKTSVHAAKWARSAQSVVGEASKLEPLFYLKDGTAMPVLRENDPVFAAAGLLRDRFESRDVAQPFKPQASANLILRLRGLLGISARCEILAFLLLNSRGSPRAVARDCYYFPATVSKALFEMSASGYLVSRMEGRHRYYQLASDAWRELLVGGACPPWVTWARLFGALEQIWLILWHEDLMSKSALAQASALRRILRHSVADRLDRSGLSFTFRDESAYTGETLIPYFVDRLTVLMRKLDDKAV